MKSSTPLKLGAFALLAAIGIVLGLRVLALEHQSFSQSQALATLREELRETLDAEYELQTALAIAVYLNLNNEREAIAKEIAMDAIADFYHRYRSNARATSKQTELLKTIDQIIQTLPGVATEIENRKNS